MLPVRVDPTSMLAPGHCVKCHANSLSPREYFINSGVVFDYEGVIYYCNLCIGDLVNASPDFFTKLSVDSITAAYNSQIKVLEREAFEARTVLARLEVLGFDTARLLEGALNGNGPGSGIDVFTDIVRAEPVSDERDRGEQPELDFNESTSVEPDVSGPFSVPSLNL